MSTVINKMDPANYLEERVEDQLRYYEKSANKAKRVYTRIQIAIIVLGLLVPVVVNIPTDWNNGVELDLAIRIAVTIMSLALAILNGVSNFRKYGDLWLSYRMTEELLKHEKFLFLARAGKYSEAETAYSEFAQTIESILSAEHNKFRSLVEDAKRPAGGGKPLRPG